jgi:hypothetical protein
VVLTAHTGIHARIADVVDTVDPLSPEDIARKVCAVCSDDAYDAYVERVRTWSYERGYGALALEYVELFNTYE